MKYISVLVLAFSIILLCGCGTTKVVATPPEVIVPPAYLIEDCPQTPFTKLETNAEIVISFQTLYLDFKDCNNKNKALREWYQKMLAKQEK